MRWLPGALACAAVAAALASPSRAENWDHPGLVHVDKLGWVSRDDAAKKGCVEYRGRWVAKDLLRQLKAWEAEDAKHATWRDAYNLDSKHYRIVTDVPRFVVELEIKPFLDELYDTYVDVFRRDFGVSSKAANKKTIRIHDGYADYAANETDETGPPPRTTPGFIVGGTELAVFYDEDDPGNFYGTVFHEGAHQFMAAVFPAATLPNWLDEAMATYFEGCVYSRAERKIRVGHVPPDRLDHAIEVLRGAKATGTKSLADELFMSVPEERFEAVHYALAWSFVHYLVNAEGGKGREQFAKVLRDLNGSGTRPFAEVFERSTGLRMNDVEAGWRAFVLAQKVEPMPWWVAVSLGDSKPPADCDVCEGDLVVAIDGADVFDPQSFERLWAARPTDRPVELVLLRRKACAGNLEYTQTRIVTRVRAGAGVQLAGTGAELRSFNLRD